MRSIPLPGGWGEDPLTDFMQAAFGNSLAVFKRKKKAFRFLIQIEEVFGDLVRGLHNVGDPLLPTLFHRTHGAFLASCRLSISGQATETFPLLRSCIEYTLYALHIHANPSYAEIWELRHESENARKKTRSYFTHQNVMKTLLKCDLELHNDIQQLYEQTIDFGAHPNAYGVSMSTKTWKEGPEVVVRNQLLHGDTPAMRHTLASAILVGINSLMVFRHIFKERFDDLGISDTLDSLKRATQ